MGSGLTNRDDDQEYIVRLVGQVVRVSVETVKIVKSLPSDFTDARPDDSPSPTPGQSAAPPRMPAEPAPKKSKKIPPAR